MLGGRATKILWVAEVEKKNAHSCKHSNVNSSTYRFHWQIYWQLDSEGPSGKNTE